MEGYVVFTCGVVCGILVSYLVSDLVFSQAQQVEDED